MSENSALEKGLQAIETLHKKDMAASKAGDFETLRSLISDDAVIRPPGGNSIRGKAELDANFGRMKEASGQAEVLEYFQEFEEVKVIGDYAFEWGTVRGAMRSKESGETERSSYQMMRVLKRQSDGEWKVHRSIWNASNEA